MIHDMLGNNIRTYCCVYSFHASLGIALSLSTGALNSMIREAYIKFAVALYGKRVERWLCQASQQRLELVLSNLAFTTWSGFSLSS